MLYEFETLILIFNIMTTIMKLLNVPEQFILEQMMTLITSQILTEIFFSEIKSSQFIKKVFLRKYWIEILRLG